MPGHDWPGGGNATTGPVAGGSGDPVADQTAEPGEGAGRVGRAAVIADGPPGQAAGDTEAISDTLGLVVHRLFGIGLGLQFVTSHADDITAQRLQHMLDELDDLIDDVRSAAFSLGRRSNHR
jgi:hypothetical protein